MLCCRSKKRKCRKCVICEIQQDQNFKYDLRDLRPGGIVYKSNALQLTLENIRNKKTHRVMCIDCYARVNHLFEFKRRVGFVPSIMQRRVDVKDMCVICFHYCPTNMSANFDSLVVKNYMLITKVFHINFLYIINNKKQTCEECLGNLSNFIQLHITFKLCHPEIESLLSSMTASDPSIAGDLNATEDVVNTTSSTESLGLNILFERNLPIDTDSTYNRYFKRHRDYGHRNRVPLPTIPEQEQCTTESTDQEIINPEAVVEPQPEEQKCPDSPENEPLISENL